MGTKLKLVTATGYTKEEAAINAGFELDVKYDATLAWTKEEAPEGADLEVFAKEYLAKKVKGAVGVGIAITADRGIADSRERPYKVTNIVTDGPRHFTLIYEGVTADNKIVFTSESKLDALQAAKDYVTEHRVNVRVRIAKVVDKGQADAFSVEYTPSINTRLGSYIFFGYTE